MRFERRLDHAREEVWSALTDPDRLARWLGRAALQPVEGGTFQLRWDETEAVLHGTVTAVEPPGRFAYVSDAHGEIRFELTPDGDGCRLVLVGALPGLDPPEGSLAAWHVHLDLLERV